MRASAYHAELAPHQQGWVLALPEGVSLLKPTRKPQELTGELGPHFCLAEGSVVFWREGKIHRFLLAERQLRELAEVAQPPHRWFCEGRRLAWLERGDFGERVRQLESGEARTVYSSPHRLSAGTVVQDWVFVAEELEGGAWRLAGASLASRDGQATFGRRHRGRTPSAIVARQQLFFYDGPTRSVLRVDPADLASEHVVSSPIICSPLAVSSRIFCGHVRGLFMLSKQEGSSERASPALLATPSGPVTAIAAAANAVAWVEDAGGGRLRVRSVSGLDPAASAQ